LIKHFQYAAIASAFGLLLTTSPLAAAESDHDSPTCNVPTFNMVVSAGAKTCLPKANATVRVRRPDQ